MFPHVKLPAAYARVAHLELTRVYELVRKQHDVAVHAVLMRQVDDGGGVSVREALEEADVETSFASGAVADLRRRRVRQFSLRRM